MRYRNYFLATTVGALVSTISCKPEGGAAPNELEYCGHIILCINPAACEQWLELCSMHEDPASTGSTSDGGGTEDTGSSSSG